ncbi:uncharacterized protein LOC141708885 [Apium graveolens]|uniref:uncharacterized protein LOC141708885 n=1 Tax=Apium graveolens TaxID=4045 RepID=UPI003D7A97B8
MTVEEEFGSLKAHEEQIKGQSDNGGEQLMFTEEEWTRRENSSGKLLLTKEEWMSKTNKNGGHFAYQCKKPRRDREQKPEVNKTQAEEDEPALLLLKCEDKNTGMELLNEENVDLMLNKSIEEAKMSQVWYLDNGAIQHMTGDRGKFKELDQTVTGQVRFGDGSTVAICGKGVISFLCKNGKEWKLKDVYYIPTLCNNTLSLGQLAEEGSKVVLEEDQLRIYNKEGALLMRVRRSANRLYKISHGETQPECGLSNVEEGERDMS